jgi:hypothetical protein
MNVCHNSGRMTGTRTLSNGARVADHTSGMSRNGMLPLRVGRNNRRRTIVFRERRDPASEGAVGVEAGNSHALRQQFPASCDELHTAAIIWRTTASVSASWSLVSTTTAKPLSRNTAFSAVNPPI